MRANDRNVPGNSLKDGLLPPEWSTAESVSAVVCAQLSSKNLDAAERALEAETLRAVVPVVYRQVARKFGEDAAQEMALHLLQSKCTYKNERSTAALMWTIARRCSKRRNRRRDREGQQLERFSKEERGNLATSNPAEDLLRKEDRRQLRQRVQVALRELRPEDRALVEHVYLRGRPLEEFDPRIAQSPLVRNRFHVRMHRVRRKLSRLLSA